MYVYIYSRRILYPGYTEVYASLIKVQLAHTEGHQHIIADVFPLCTGFLNTYSVGDFVPREYPLTKAGNGILNKYSSW